MSKNTNFSIEHILGAVKDREMPVSRESSVADQMAQNSLCFTHVPYHHRVPYAWPSASHLFASSCCRSTIHYRPVQQWQRYLVSLRHPFLRQHVFRPPRKRVRASFSHEQVLVLQKIFEEQKYLSSTERTDLAAKLNMTEQQIKIWFQNRRYKEKKQQKLDELAIEQAEPFIDIETVQPQATESQREGHNFFDSEDNDEKKLISKDVTLKNNNDSYIFDETDESWENQLYKCSCPTCQQ